MQLKRNKINQIMFKFLQKFSEETIGAIFVIALVSAFIISSFFIGFNLPIFLLAISISFLIVISYPRSGLYAIIFLTFIFERFFTLQPIILNNIEYKIYPLDFILLAVILGTSLNLISGKIKIKLNKTDLFLVGFIFFTGIYFILGMNSLDSDLSLAFSSLKNYAFYPLLYFLVILLLDSNVHLKRFLLFGFAGALVISFFILYGIVSGEGAWTEFTPLSTAGVRILAFTHAFYLTMAFIVLFVYMVFRMPKSRWPYLLAVIWGIGILGSMMRHLWISIFVSLALTFAIVGKEKRDNFIKIISKYSLAGLALIFIFYYLSFLAPNSKIDQTVVSVNDMVSERIYSLVNFSGDDSFSWRAVVWSEALTEYFKSPILGIGLGKYLSIEMGKYHDLVEVRNVHNSLLALFIQMGVIAFGLFVIWIFYLIKGIQDISRKTWFDVAMVALAINYLIAFMFQPYLEANLLGIFFWIIFGLIRVVYNEAYEG